MFLGKIVKDTFPSASVNLPRFEEGNMVTSSLVTGISGAGTPSPFNCLKEIIKPGVAQDSRPTAAYYPVYLDYGVTNADIPASTFTNYFSYNVADYSTKVRRLGRLFIQYQSLPYYLSYVDASDPRGLNKILPTFFLNTNTIYRGFFKLFMRTYNDRTHSYEIVSDPCFAPDKRGCINNERNFVFVHLVDSLGNRKGFDSITVGPEIDDTLYTSLTSVGAIRDNIRFKQASSLELARSVSITNNERKYLGPPFISSYTLYETNLVVVNIDGATRANSDGTKIIDNSFVPGSSSTRMSISYFENSGGKAKVYYNNTGGNHLGKDDNIPSYSVLYIRRVNGATYRYYKIISSNLTGQNNAAKTVWKVVNNSEDEYIFVNLRVSDTRTDLTNVSTSANYAATVGKISKWENDDIITIA
jgi:hypothetical protein